MLGGVLDIRVVVAFGCENGDLRSIHSNVTRNDGNAEASTDPRGPCRAMNRLTERLSFNRVGSPGHNISSSDDDLPVSQSTHDVPHDGGGWNVSRQNVFWPELLDVLEHELTTRRRAWFAHEQRGGAKFAQAGAAEDSSNAVRNQDHQTAIAAAESLIFSRPTWVNDGLGEQF